MHPSSIHPSTSYSPNASYRQLSIIFILALLIFTLLRWQPEAWIQAQLENQAQRHGISIHLNALHLSGLTLDIQHITIRPLQLTNASSPLNASTANTSTTNFSTTGPNTIESIIISPAWSLLLQAQIGLNIHILWHQQPIDLILHQAQNNIVIQPLNATLDTATLMPLLKDTLPIPLDIKGTMHINANVTIDTMHARPLLGDIHLSWNQASIGMPSMQLPPLGNYTLDLQSSDHASPWQWTLNGGTALKLSGNGSVDTSATAFQAWLLSGDAHAQADQHAPMLSALLGNKDQRFRLTGTMLQPHIQSL